MHMVHIATPTQPTMFVTGFWLSMGGVGPETGGGPETELAKKTKKMNGLKLEKSHRVVEKTWSRLDSSKTLEYYSGESHVKVRQGMLKALKGVFLLQGALSRQQSVLWCTTLLKSCLP
jgi:hypothetical protein